VLGIRCPDGLYLVLYHGKSRYELSRRYEVEEDGVLRDKPGAPFKNLVYSAAAGVLRYRHIELVSGEAALEKAQLLTFDFPLNTMLNGGHWSPGELYGWAAECPDLATRLEARRGAARPLKRPLPADEAADYWSSGDESDPEAEAVRAARSRGGKMGGKMGGKKGAARSRRPARELAGALLVLAAYIYEKGWATRRAKAAAVGGVSGC
jgi:hypothetical protein